MPRFSNAIAPGGIGRLAAGTLIAIAIATLVALAVLSITLVAQAPAQTTRVDIPHLVRMTTIQAGLTTVLSVGIGIVLAWVLDRLHFTGRDLVTGFLAAAIVTPGIVVAVGLLAVWGRNGWINALLAPLGLKTGSIYGLGGILFAHVILDASFAARILLARLDAIPHARLKTGQSLGLSSLKRFLIIDWPAMAGSVPGISAVIFLLAFTSFPIVLILGGGPANQTLEVAIYSAVRLDFDLDAAVRLALVQLAICAAIVLPAATVSPTPPRAGVVGRHRWPDAPSVTAMQILLLVVALVIFALPLIAVLVDGFGPGFAAVLGRPSFWQATLTSLGVGASSALLTLVLALGLVMARSEAAMPLLRTVLGFPVYAYLAVPSVVLGLGFFLMVRGLGLAPIGAAPLVLVLANTLLALPFAVATLGPPFDALRSRYARLSRSLGLNGFERWRYVEWPTLGREIGIVLALGFCFSLGDLGIISLFGTDDFTTLPWAMVRALGAYRTNDAAAIAALLLTISFAAFLALPILTEKLSAHARR